MSQWNICKVYWRILNKSWRDFFCRFCAGDIELKSIWTSSQTYMLPRTQWFRLVLRFSSTFTMDQVLLWVNLGTICSLVRRWLSSSNQRLYLQQRVHHSLRAYLQTRSVSFYRACLWTPVTMGGHKVFMVMSQFQHWTPWSWRRLRHWLLKHFIWWISIM